MKRKGNLGGIFAMALILVLALALGVGSVSAAEPTIVDSGNCGKDGSNVTWTLDSNGLLTISGTGEMESDASESTPWSKNKKSIKEVVIESGVTNIRNFAFKSCENLTKVTIPDSVVYIGWNAFYRCTALTKVYYNARTASCVLGVFTDSGTFVGGFKAVFGESVEQIPDNLFYGCINLTSVTIGSNVSSIGEKAFFNCTGLNSVEIPDGVASIGNYAFYGCTGLTGVTIGSNVTSIGDSAFYNCTGLKEVIYNAKAITDGSYAFKEAGTAADGMKVVFGESVEKIPSELFYNCTALTGMTIPDSVISIGDWAFSGCTGLKEVIYNAKAITDGSYAFKGAGTAEVGMEVIFGESVKEIPNDLFYDCAGLTSVTIPDSVTSIGDYAFRGCTGLTGVTIPDGVTSIGDYAFNGCTGLKEVIYNARAAECSKYDVFQNAGTAADGMKVVFGESVEKIPDYLFSGCTGLTGVTIGRNVTSIGREAFRGCTSLTEINYNARRADDLDGSTNAFYDVGAESEGVVVKFGEDVEIIPACLFYTNTPTPKIKIVSVSVGNRVTEIGEYAFCNCVNLTSLKLGNSVSTIGSEAFGSCEKLSSITGIEGVKQIGYSTFRYCSSLETFTIGENLTRIGTNAFYKCIGLKEVYYNAKAAEDLESSLSGVFQYAGGSGGVRVIFGENVKKIPAYLFDNAGNICSFVFTGNPPTVGTEGLGYAKAYAFYPGHNSEWTETVREACGSHLTWIGYCMEPVSSAACRIDQTAYLPNDTLNTQGLCMTLPHKDGCTETIPYDSGLLELGSCDMSIPGAKTIDVTYRGTTAQLKIYVHERKTQTLDKKGYPESSHNYENNLDKTYTYKAAGAASLDVTFSAQTEVETNIDYLYVNGAQYTGTELAGKTLTISGDTLTIRLVSDKSDSAYGFSIDSIVVTYMCHEYEDTVVPPTCTEQGYTLRSCPCGSEVKQNYVDALGHDMVTDAAVAPTCTKTGLTEGSHCSRCDGATTAQKTVPALGHDMVTDAAVAPTCTKTGLTEGSHCSRCDGATTAQKTVPALGHDMVTDAAVAPTCTEAGLTEGSHCTRCDGATTAQKTVPALGHDMVTDAAVAPTCTEAGLTEGSHCSRCDGATTAQKTVPALGHDMVTDAAVAPTCTKTGLTEGSHCSRCDGATTAQKVVPALGHDMVTDAAVAPTCTEAGMTEGSHCSRCGTVLKAQAEISALGHDYKNGTCTRCGAKNPNNKPAAPAVKPDYLLSTGKPYLKWKAVDGAVKYYVYRSGSKSGTYKYIGTATKLNYTDTTAKPGYYYYYKVKAVNASGVKSSYSTAVTALCHCARPKLNDAQYQASTGKPYLSWGAVTGAGKYYVYRAGSQNGAYKYIGSTTKTNYTDTTASAGYTYYYKVEAVSKVRGAANSANSTALAVNSHCARPTVKPDYLASTGKPYLKWSAVTGASKYHVYRAGSQNGTYKYIGSTTKTNYTDTTASAGYAYYYKVKAVSKVKAAANSAYSTVVKATCHCAKPVVKIALTQKGDPKLTWNAVAEAGKYEVYRATSKNGTYTKMFTTTNRSYTNTNARPGTTYYYKVKAISRVRSTANSSYSVVKSIRAR